MPPRVGLLLFAFIVPLIFGRHVSLVLWYRFCPGTHPAKRCIRILRPRQNPISQVTGPLGKTRLVVHGGHSQRKKATSRLQDAEAGQRARTDIISMPQKRSLRVAFAEFRGEFTFTNSNAP